MCARITVDCHPAELSELIGMPVRDASPPTTRSWNGPPGAPYMLLRPDGVPDRAKLQAVRWGILPDWTTDGRRLINARAESAAVKPSFRQGFRHDRALLPVTGWYEWQATGRRKQPFRIRQAEGGTILIGAICASSPGAGGMEDTFAVLTTMPRSEISKIHDRQPAIIAPADARAWLSSATSLSTIRTLALGTGDQRLEGYPVSPRLNNTANNDRGLAQPVHAGY